MLYVGYIITYPGIMARPVSGIPSTAFFPAHKSVGMHLNIQKRADPVPGGSHLSGVLGKG